MKSIELPASESALPGRSEPMSVPSLHFVKGKTLKPPFPEASELAMFGMGCFWGAEKRFWQLEDVFSTAVGYSAGYTPNPVYEEVCTGATGHNEVVLVVFSPKQVSYQFLLEQFWQTHNPTQGMRQGNDIGTQYRSGIYTYNNEQRVMAAKSLEAYQLRLTQDGLGKITTEIADANTFYYAEDYHQQYLAKNPGGYCGLAGSGVSYRA